MSWETEYEHWRDKGHTWGPGIDDYTKPAPEDAALHKKEMEVYESELEKIRTKPREQYVQEGKRIHNLLDLSRKLSNSSTLDISREDVQNMILKVCIDVAETLGYSLSLRDRHNENQNAITVSIEHIGFIPERDGNLHQYTVSGIENPNDALQLVADFFAIGKYSTTYYKNHFVSISDPARLRKEMEGWGINFDKEPLNKRLQQINKERAGIHYNISKEIEKQNHER